MIQKYGLVLGGLQQKILNLVLIATLVITIIFGVSAARQQRILSETVTESGAEQQTSISEISSQAVDAAVNASLSKTTALQAYIANDMFDDVRGDVSLLQSFATTLFEHREALSRQDVSYSIADNDGIPSVQYMHKAGADSRSADLDVITNMSDMLLSMYTASERLDSCYIATVDGHILFANDRSGTYIDDKGRPVRIFDATERDWFQSAAKAGDVCFTGVTYDAYTGTPSLTCSAPVYCHGEMVAVVGVDIFLESMVDYINASVQSGGFICIFDKDGRVLFSPQTQGAFAPYVPGSPNDTPGTSELADLVKNAPSGSAAVQQIEVDGQKYWVATSALTVVDWVAVSVVDEELTKTPERQMLSELDQISSKATSEFRARVTSLTRQMGFMIVLALVLSYIGALIMATRIVKPVNSMSKKIVELAGTSEAFEVTDLYRTGDEIEVLAESFEEMTRKNLQHIEEITNITKEKERLETELGAGTQDTGGYAAEYLPCVPRDVRYLRRIRHHDPCQGGRRRLLRLLPCG